MPLPSDKPAPPTRFRYVILALLCLLAMITYMDRAANGSAKKAIMADLNAAGESYTEDDFFIVLMAFQLAYAIFEVPSGWLGDTVGPRSTLLRVVLWWSAFVALTGFTAMTLPGGLYVGFYSLILIQFLFGVGEAGAFPNIAKALYNWFPAGDRGFAKSAVWTAARCMGGLTPLIWVLLVPLGGLRWNDAMWLFAAVAALWCVAFVLIFRNKPGEHPSVNEAERALIDAGRAATDGRVHVPLGRIVRSRNLWAVCCMYVVTNFCWYFLMYNHPRMMQEEYKDWNATDRGKILLALLSGAPLLVGMFGCLLGGLLSDRYIRRTGDRKWGRRLFGMIGYGGAGLCYLAAAGVKYADPGNLWLFAGLLVLMGFCNDLIMAPAWAVCQDIGLKYAATVSGFMNMFGNLVGAVTGILVTGLITKRYPGTDGFLICFVMYAAVYGLGVVAWLFIDATKPVAPDDHATAGTTTG
jgi:ACS family glucarate transporter-like MFS transporter